MNHFPGSILFSEKILYRLARHLFLFVGMNLLFTWVLVMRDTNGQSISGIGLNVFINSLFFFGYAYLTAYLLMPGLIMKGRYLLFFLVFLAAGIGISWLKFAFSDYLFYSAIGDEVNARIRAATLSSIMVNTKDMTFIVALFLIAKFAKDNHQVRNRLALLQDDQIRSEIRLLRNQLDPHVVFNNLNNLYCLSLNHSPAVNLNLGKLRSVLSYYFEDGKQKQVKLKRELQIIRDYLDLEKLRYGDRLTVDFRVEGDPGGKEISPLLLFPFVENSLEHGCSMESGSSWIRIYVKIEDGSITFHVANSKPEMVLEAVKEEDMARRYQPEEKLQLLYPGKYMIRIDDRKDMYGVDFKLKL